LGGAVMAARLGAWAKANKKTVLVIEKGFDHTGTFDAKRRSEGGELNAQGNRFRHTLDPRYTSTVADLYTDTSGAFRAGVSSMTVVAGRGLGGGSNVYDGVSLRAPTETFDQRTGDQRLWPSAYTRTILNPYYATVEQRLSVHRLQWTDKSVPHWQLATKRDWVFADGCSRIGATAVPLKLADKDDANEGWWNQGQRFEGRQSLTKNYLQDARTAGVAFRTCSEVDTVARDGDAWILRGNETHAGGGTTTEFEIEAKLVIVAAGSVASTGLLLRSRDGLAAAIDPGGVLGKHVSGNGDYGVTGVVGPKYTRNVDGYRGKPMSSFCPSFWKEHKFLLIPFHADPLYVALGRPTTLLRGADALFERGATKVSDGERDWGLAFKQRFSTFGPRALTMGCLALDQCEGEIRLGRDGRTEVAWESTRPETDARWRKAIDTMRRIYEALGGEMFLDGYRKDGTVSTAHPLGGCRMTDRTRPKDGVVDSFGEVIGCDNLFVVDGAIIPSALGVNPSLTIAAVAESIADRLVNGLGTKRLADRLPA
jgi:cholesterol oxidase